MKNFKFLAITFIATILVSCNRPEPNYEGVLMTDYGRNGIESFSVVTGAQGPLGPGSSLYEVPMYEEKADCDATKVTARDAGKFTVDPSYTYQATRGKGPYIVLSYKHLGTGSDFFDNIENNVLDKLVTDTFREEARNYSTDSLMNNLGAFEKSVETIVTTKFNAKGFTLNTLTSGLTPPESMGNAIEARNNAIQQANQVKNQLETSKMLLEKARIDAETNKVQSSGLTKEVLTRDWIKAIKPTDKVIISDGRTPVIIGQ